MTAPGRYNHGSRYGPAYAELHALSNFSFLRGASHPEELVAQASALNYQALALTDECSLAGIVRAHTAARESGLSLIIGSEFVLDDGLRIALLAPDRQAYANLAGLITQARARAPKGSYLIARSDLESGADGCLALLFSALPSHQASAKLLNHSEPGNKHTVQSVATNHDPMETTGWFAETFRNRGWLSVELFLLGYDWRWLRHLQNLGKHFRLPLVATNDVHMHQRSRRALQDTVTAIRLGTTVSAAGHQLESNGERHLRSRSRLSDIYPAELLAQTIVIANRCHFSLDELRYQCPQELVPSGATATSYLRTLTEAGIRRRWPEGVSAKVRKLVEHELKLIEELDYERYFLTVYDIVAFARSQNILCQGRGSAANSAVCYCLEITEVDPARMEILFERFISKERNEPPDIDVDFEHERREEVIQYIYNKYGRDRAALAATVVTYRPKSAIRDVGKALGMSLEQVDRLASSLSWWDGKQVVVERIREAGFDPDNFIVHRLISLVNELVGFPRHLSQHVGGFIISHEPLSRIVPIENAAMADRTVIQWDKDDIEVLGLLKMDCLGLGMLSAIRKSLDMISQLRSKPFTMADVPAEDPAVYQMIQKADTVGVFQIESRAQMSMLPRLKPACFYDLVIEVAIVRPGPIQGDMVHPYLRRRQGLEPVNYPSEAVREVLERTLGVPIFQEQVIKLAMVAAGFSAGEADGLRRSMAAWRRRGGLEHWEHRLKNGMAQRGYKAEFAERIFRQILGFGEYGFPESHAASFSLLVYVSAWIKHHEPAVFAAALINSQPMGFYAPAQLIRDATSHGVEVRPVDVTVSDWDCTVESNGDTARPSDTAPRSAAMRNAAPRNAELHHETTHKDRETVEVTTSDAPATMPQPAIRLGLRMVKGLTREGGERLINSRQRLLTEGRPPSRPFDSIEELVRRSRLQQGDIEALAQANALRSLVRHRHLAQWHTSTIELTDRDHPLLDQVQIPEGTPMLREPTEASDVVADYASVGLTLGKHPLAILRNQLDRLGIVKATDVDDIPHGELVTVAGLVITRQRPASANNVAFITLEDESGYLQAVVWKTIAERQRRTLTGARLMGIHGEVQRESDVTHIIAKRLDDRSYLLGNLLSRSRDFR